MEWGLFIPWGLHGGLPETGGRAHTVGDAGLDAAHKIGGHVTEARVHGIVLERFGAAPGGVCLGGLKPEFCVCMFACQAKLGAVCAAAGAVEPPRSMAKVV